MVLRVYIFATHNTNSYPKVDRLSNHRSYIQTISFLVVDHIILKYLLVLIKCYSWFKEWCVLPMSILYGSIILPWCNRYFPKYNSFIKRGF